MARRDPVPSEDFLKQLSQAVAGMRADDALQLIGQLLADTHAASTAPTPRPSRRRPRRHDGATLRLRVDLEHARPPIWRRLDVRSDIGLDVLHQVLQAAFGWTDSHLHRFALGASVFDRDAEMFLCPFDVEEGDEDGVPAKDVRIDETLAEPGDVLRYCYDYGDSWDLNIRLESVHPVSGSAPVATCVDGRRAAPPEDCGGLRDAIDLVEVLDDPARFDLEEINQALTDPYLALLDLGVNARLVDILNRLRGTEAGDELVSRVISLTRHSFAPPSADEISAALHPFRWFLDRVGDDGIPLTSAGYLKPDDVIATAAVVPRAVGWIGTNNREVHTFPVLQFRESLQGLGLTRKSRGRLRLTRAGATARRDPDQLWRHLVERLPLGRQTVMESPAGLLAMLLVASSPGDDVPFELVARALTHLGWRQGGRDPISAHIAGHAAVDSLDVLRNITTGPRASGWDITISDVAKAMARAVVLGVVHA